MTYSDKIQSLHKLTRSSLNQYAIVAREIKIMIDKGQYIPKEKLEFQNTCFTAFQYATSLYSALLMYITTHRIPFDEICPADEELLNVIDFNR